MSLTLAIIAGPIGWLFRKFGWSGVTLPCGRRRVLVLMWATKAKPPTLEEIDHEVLGHVPQIRELGGFRYITRILYEYARYGHDNAPMEIDARRRAEQC